MERETEEWCTPKENLRHAVATGLKRGSDNHRRRVRQLTLDGELIATHNSIIEASRATDCNAGNIGSACRGIRYRSVGGFRWEYVKEEPALPLVNAATAYRIPDDDPFWSELGL